MTNRGGEEILVRHVLITDNAYKQYSELNPGQFKTHLGQMLEGITIRRLADNSKWWVYIHQDVRYVFTVMNGRKEESGRFALTSVQLQWACKQ